MTLDQFVARLARKVKREKPKVVLFGDDHNRVRLIWRARRHCPISFVAGGVAYATTTIDGRPLLGLTNRQHDAILNAADGRKAGSLRSKLLKACGL